MALLRNFKGRYKATRWRSKSLSQSLTRPSRVKKFDSNGIRRALSDFEVPSGQDFLTTNCLNLIMSESLACSSAKEGVIVSIAAAIAFLLRLAATSLKGVRV